MMDNIFEIHELTDETIKQAFAKSLHELRKHCNLSLTKLAEETFVPHQSISVYERGINMPTIAQALRLTAYFNMSIDDFIWYGIGAQAPMLEEDFTDITTKYDVENA